MAGKRILTSPTEDDGAVKRLRVDPGSDGDPITDLTDDQLVVLFTLMLCPDRYGRIGHDTVKYVMHTDDAVMGNIAVLKTLHELRDKGLVTLMSEETNDMGYATSNLNDRNSYHLSIRKYSQVMRRFVKEYLNNDIDKEFFLSVAPDRCLQLYVNTFFRPQTGENHPITLMRLIIGSEVGWFYQEDYFPSVNKSLTEMRNFVLARCQKENLDPISWADKVPNERIKSFYSASIILQPLQKELLDIPKGARGILFSILLSSGYSITLENDNWRIKLVGIREKFCMSESEPEDLETIRELVERLAILKKSGQRVTFTSENIKHKVMTEFVMCCLKTDKDYESYLRMTSDDSVIEYCTFWNYRRHTTERCLYIPSFLEDVLMEKLNFFAVLQAKHITDQDVEMGISGKYDISLTAMDCDEVTWIRFAEAVIGMGIGRVNLNSVLCSIFIFHQRVNEDDCPIDLYDESGSDQDSDDESQKLIQYSAIVRERRKRYNALERARQLYLPKQRDPESCDTGVLNQQVYIDGGTQRLSLSPREWAILIYILLADDYVLNIDTLSEAKQRNIQEAFVLLQDVTLLSEIECMAQSEKYDKVLAIEDKKIIRFASDEIRHQVMSYFVLNCLKTDEDYNNYIRLSSVDSLLEYVRTWYHERDGDERCLYIKETMLDNFVDKLGLDSLRHVMIDDEEVRKIVQEKVNIPREIFDWEYEARCRYVLCAKKGTQTIHRARAMIVGCAGAGKTTLLKRLRKCSQEEINKVQSTVGLEIHEDIFEIADEENVLRALQEESNKEGKQLLSIVDFAGQCAYYACHQVYLSRRAFYLLVIDMSKPFSEKVDPKLCEQAGTMFTDWTYGEYLLFWMKSVHTYCDDDTPVIIVGTHLDKTSGQTSDTLFNKILEHLGFNSELTTHLDRKRCFVLGFQMETDHCVDTIAHLEKCIVFIAKKGRWKETIPIDWALCEVVLREHKRKGEKIMTVSKLTQTCFGNMKDKYSQIDDVLKLYHDMGVVLHFPEKHLNETVIIDIQWFVDAFNNVITDPNHVCDVVENERDWKKFIETGHLESDLLCNLLRIDVDDKDSYEFYMDDMFWIWSKYKRNLLQYMQRLGLIANGQLSHYIPSMNKRTFGVEESTYFEALRCKTSVLVYKFHFLPYFYYFRLIVACLKNKEWNILENKGQCLYKNVACFMCKEHVLALAVTKSSIQLQILQPENKPVEKEVALQVRDTVDILLRELTQNFHKNVMYIVGYQCSKQEVFVEHDDCFIEETEIYGKGEIPCPKHGMTTYHRINEQGLLSSWKKDVLPVSERTPVLEEKDLPKFIKMFGKDIYIQALYLSLSENEIEIIKMESPNSVREQIYNILLKWKRKSGQGATTAALREAMERCEEDTGTTVDWEAFHKGVKSIVD